MLLHQLMGQFTVTLIEIRLQVERFALPFQIIKSAALLPFLNQVFDLPPGAYAVRTGHYTLPDVARIPRLDGSDGAVDLGVFCWE